MADLFENMKEFSDVVGGGANLSIQIPALRPTIDNAARKYIIPWIGSVYTEIKNKEIDPGVNDYSAEELALIPYIKRSLAHFAMFEYVPVGSVQFSGAGLVRSESENVKTAYKYQENNYRDSMLENGYELLEEMIFFLEENAANYPLWTGEIRERSRDLFLNSATIFRLRYSSYVTRWTYEILRPIIEDLETFGILPTIGQELFDDLKLKQKAETLSDKEKQAIVYIQKALASLSVREAIKRYWVRLEGNKVIYNERSESQSSQYERPGEEKQLLVLAKSEAIIGNRYLDRLTSYLDENAADFTGWPLTIEETLENTENTNNTDPENNSKILIF